MQLVSLTLETLEQASRFLKQLPQKHCHRDTHYDLLHAGVTFGREGGGGGGSGGGGGGGSGSGSTPRPRGTPGLTPFSGGALARRGGSSVTDRRSAS